MKSGSSQEDRERLRQFYETSHEYKKLLDAHDRTHLKPYVDTVVKYAPAESSILDVGCGGGQAVTEHEAEWGPVEHDPGEGEERREEDRAREGNDLPAHDGILPEPRPRLRPVGGKGGQRDGRRDHRHHAEIENVKMGTDRIDTDLDQRRRHQRRRSIRWRPAGPRSPPMISGRRSDASQNLQKTSAPGIGKRSSVLGRENTRHP